MSSDFRAVAAVGHVLRSTFGNIGFALRMSWPWMVFILVIQVLIIFLFPDFEAATATDPATAANLTPRLLTVFAVSFVASLVAFSSIAVNWHRYILLDEEAAGWDRLRLDAPVMRYMGVVFQVQLLITVGVLLGLLALLAFGVVLYAVASQAIANLVIGLAAIALFLSALAIGQRISIKLPAVAIERSDYGIRDALADTEGNNWRLIGFVVMVSMMIMVLALVVAAPIFALGLGTGGQTAFWRLAFLCLQFAANWLSLILGVTSLTTLYGIFAEGRSV